MSTRTMTLFALMTGLVACADDATKGDAAGTAVFAEANGEQLVAAITVATGGDAQLAAMMVTFLDWSDTPCIAVIPVDDGLRYEDASSSGCEGEFITGAVTVYGVTEPGWSMEPTGDVEIVFDNADFGGTDEETGEYMPWLIDGDLAISSSRDGTQRIEADLVQDFFGLQLESHVRMSGEDGSLTHQAGSRGSIEGLGTFAISGSSIMVETANEYRTGGSFELNGVDTMRVEVPTTDDECITYEIDGDTDEFCMD